MARCGSAGNLVIREDSRHYLTDGFAERNAGMLNEQTMTKLYAMKLNGLADG